MGTAASAGYEDQEFGVYVHWPFCKAKCPYCDFNSHVRHGGVDDLAFANGLARELQWFARQAPGRTVTSVFFGGGTPSLMPPGAVALVIDEINRLWPVSNDVEITMEANPTSIEAENFQGYRTAGVNRMSVGVQALNDVDLKALGRQHTASEALDAFALAAKVFERTSFDLIYARPGQTPAQWREELKRALEHQTGHMSLYQLTIEPDTRFFDLHEAGALKTPDEETGAQLYEVTQELTEAAGLPAYEVSNHARPGHASRHNMTYWRYYSYAGVGPGAHARLHDMSGEVSALSTERNPEDWLSMVRSQGNGIVERNLLSPRDAAVECVLMGLRTSEGVGVERLRAISGKQINFDAIEDLFSLGFLHTVPVHEDARLIATPKGRQVLNALIEQIVLKALR